MQNAPSHSASETKPRRALRWQFGLKSLFLLLTLAAWCTWQWTITQRRQNVIAELDIHYVTTFHDSVVEERGTETICSSMQWSFGKKIEEPIRPGFISSITGWENQRGLTVFIHTGRFSPRLPVGDDLDGLSALARLQGLTTVVLWDSDPESASRIAVVQFKDVLRKKLPHVKVLHVCGEALPVG